ncbi:MAG: signal recognition particle receptor subunit alpha, partial [Hadesarchaea archaeon]|nr:signal recognition particle receptor subunit alpha [Hadesarchaea archaeon]
MVLDRLGRTLHSALRKLTRTAHVDERVVKELVRDIQRALLQADV